MTTTPRCVFHRNATSAADPSDVPSTSLAFAFAFASLAMSRSVGWRMRLAVPLLSGTRR